MALTAYQKQGAGNSRVVFWLIVVFFVFEYMRLQTLIPGLGPLHVPMFLSAALMMWWLFRGEKTALADPLIRLFLVFIALSATGMVFAVNQFFAYQNTKFLALFLFSVVLPFIAIVNNERRLRRFFVVWVWMHVGLALLAIAKGGTGSGGFLEDENDLALALNMALPYAWYLAAAAGQGVWTRLLFYGACGILMVGVTATLSRGGFVGLAAVLAAIALQSQQRLRNILVLLAIGIISVVFFVPDSYIAEMETISNPDDPTRGNRLYLWRRAVEMAQDYPVLGVGSGNFPSRIAEYDMKSDEFDWHTMHLHGGRAAHSLYFTILAEYGASGVLVYGAMVILVIRRLRRAARTGPGNAEHGDASALRPLANAMLQSLLGFLAAGAFITVLIYQHFWYLVGFVVALDHVARRHERLAENQSEANGARA